MPSVVEVTAKGSSESLNIHLPFFFMGPASYHMRDKDLLKSLPGIPMYDELEPFIQDWDMKKWDFQHAVISTQYLSKEDPGRISAWANREFFSRPGRAQRILYNERYHPACRLIAKSYVETADVHARAAFHDEIFV